MTKYILHGGATSKESEDNKRFFSEMLNGLPDNATILCVYFARGKNLWPELFEQDKISFSSVLPHRVFNFVLADEKTDIFIDQLKSAGLIYLRGGNTDKLKDLLSRVYNLPELFKDKIVSGSSAGAYVLSTYYANSKNDVEKGLGILPIKTFCHYTEEKSDTLKFLKEYAEDLEVYSIPEEKFSIIKK